MDRDRDDYRDRIGSLNLDFNRRRSDCNGRMEPPPPETTDTTLPDPEITAAQKQYAQGFIDALRSVHVMNNFEFDNRKIAPLLSPIIPTILQNTTELKSPFATTPANAGDMNAILQAILPTPSCSTIPVSNTSIPVSNNPGLPSPFSIFPGPNPVVSLPTIPSTSQLPTSSATSTSTAVFEKPEIQEPKEEPRIEVKQEVVLSDDSTDNMSERSRSSSAALSQSQSSMKEYGISMDEQERKKLDRKRERNRAAASKCRQKKMDRIQELEHAVSQEKVRGQSLDDQLQRLQMTLQQLQRLMEQHASKGCPTHAS